MFRRFTPRLMSAQFARRSAGAASCFASARRPLWFGGLGVAAGAAAGVVCTTAVALCASKQPVPFDIAGLKRDIEALVEQDNANGPLLIRLAWHEAGSWDKNTKDGSPNTASMRFAPECAYGGNKGLDKARKLLEPLKKKYPAASYADIWALAGCVAVETMGGPAVKFRWGRVDAKDGSACGPDGRLPDASRTQAHVREVFTRLGFNDRETVALIGAHAVGECHPANSGFVGPWTHDRYGFTNSFFTELLGNEWVLNTAVPQLQFKDKATGRLMMLPTDVSLLLDPKYRAIVEEYARSDEKFSADFAKAFQKLLELGNHQLHDV